MIRINELVKITSSGFILKLHATAKIPELWPQIVQTFLEDVKSHISEAFEEQMQQIPSTSAELSKVLEEVKLLQHNDTARATFQIPACVAFSTLHSLMSWCIAQCDRISVNLARVQNRTGPLYRVAFSASRMSLEQAFLAYASHQTQNAQN